MKIYTDDPNLPYKTTKLTAIYTKSEIDGILAKYGIHKAGWNWNPDANNVYVIFHIEETFNEVKMDVPVKVEAFAVWDHKTRNKAESINWNISMRTMYWFIKALLESAYLKQSSKTAAFLPYIINEQEVSMADTIIPRLQTLQDTLALEEKQLNKVGQTTQKPLVLNP
jgi:hypothetical protein